MKIIKVIINNKFEPIIVDQKGLPNYLMLRYICLFDKKKSYRTKYLYCKSYLFFFDFVFESKNKDIQELIIKGDFKILNEQIVNFSSWLSTKVNSNINFNIYLLSLKRILNWSILIYGNNYPDNNYIGKIINYQLKQNDFKKQVFSNILTEQILIKIYNCIYPSSKDNIFSNNNQLRNYLIFKLFNETGIRLGELLSLQIKDFIREDNRFYIHINQSINAIEDPRWNTPNIKNSHSQRFVGISEETYIIFEKYIKYIRKKGNKNFLFTSQTGAPLSKSTLSKIFKDISNNIKYIITPHFFRHQFATKMIRFLIDEKCLDIERAKDELKIICGWSINSNMPILYTKKYFEEKANTSNLERISNEYISKR